MTNIADRLSAYEVLEQRQIADLNSEGILLRHKKTGAHITLLLNDDENKVFYIGFRTPPKNSTGVAHILEHSVLCGSKNFPVKDPFIELAKGSLNTFLNAMTYPDKTVYPVASCNDADFKNLVHVYLDAVFYPNIYREKRIFEQEGWHYELENAADDLTVNGVVYNEMKGAFSSPDDVVEREIMNSLYPDVTYGLESGGDPDVIPELSYEEFLAFHQKYYHPSNSYIYLYGNLDAVEYLTFMEDNYLCSYDRLNVHSEIALQQPFTSCHELTKEYPIMEDESEEQNTYLTYNVSMGTSLDRLNYAAMDILDYVLCSAPGAPVKQALIDAGIGKDVYSTMENGIYQPYFSIIAKNADAAQKEEFLSVIANKCKELALNGIDKKALEGAVNYFEFKYREGDFGSYPRGLMLGLQALDSWLYDGKAPFLHIEANETYKTLREAIAGDYYEQLIQKYLLDNPHRSVLTVLPKKGLTTEKDAAFHQKLQDYKQSLTESELQEIVEEGKRLKSWQETPDTKEALKTIPLLKREDLKREATSYVNEERRISGTRLLVHDIFTNGIAYLTFLFDLKQVNTELFPYVGVLKSMLLGVDTANYSYGELFNEVNCVTGGISVQAGTYGNAIDLSRYLTTLEVKTKVLYPNRDEAIRLMTEILMTSDFSDDKRLYEILAETKSRMQAVMTSAGHSLAALRALSGFSATAACAQELSGLAQYRLIDDLEAHFEERKEELKQKLRELCVCIFRKENLLIDYTGTEEGLAGADAAFTAFANGLHTEPVAHPGTFVPTLSVKNEAFMTAGQVQYVCRAGNFMEQGLPYTGALKVLKVMMGYEYLWTQVRVKGGAYGCMSSFSRNGDAYFVSYRDPNLRKTITVYEKAAEFVRNVEADERTLTQFVIGAISELDTPMTPKTRGNYSLGGYLTGLSMERVQKEREELLSVTQEVLRGLADYIDAFLGKQALCVVGNGEKIKKDSDLFDAIEQLL